MRLPQQRAGARVERLEVAFASAREQQVRGRRQDAAVGDVGHLELPLLAPGAGIERDHRAVAGRFGPRVDRRAAEARARRARPTKFCGPPPTKFAADLVLRRRGRIDARVVFPGGDVEQAGARAVGRRIPVGAALIAGIGRLVRAGCGVCIGRPRSSKPLIQFTLTNGLPEEELAGRAIEHVEVAVAVGPRITLMPAAVPVVDQHRDLHRVVVVDIVRRELVMPFQLAGVGVERDDRIGVEVVAWPLRAVVVGAGVADAPIRQVELRIVGAGHPDRAAAVLPGVGIAEALRVGFGQRLPRLVAGLAGRRNRVEAPCLLAGRRVVGGDEAADAVLAAADADDHLVLDDQRRVRDRIAVRGLRDRGLPDAAARSSRRWRSAARRACP